VTSETTVKIRKKAIANGKTRQKQERQGEERGREKERVQKTAWKTGDRENDRRGRKEPVKTARKPKGSGGAMSAKEALRVGSALSRKGFNLGVKMDIDGGQSNHE